MNSSSSNNTRKKNNTRRTRSKSSRRRRNYNEFNDEESLDFKVNAVAAVGNTNSSANTKNHNMSGGSIRNMNSSINSNHNSLLDNHTNSNNDDDDSIPHFANFDNLTTTIDDYNYHPTSNSRNNHTSHSNTSSNTNTNNSTSSNKSDRSFLHISPRKKKDPSERSSSTKKTKNTITDATTTSSSLSAMAVSSIAYTDRNNKNMNINVNMDMDMNRITNNDAYDSEAASDYKWAKIQANNDDIATINNINNNNKNPAIRQLNNVGLVRRSTSTGRAGEVTLSMGPPRSSSSRRRYKSADTEQAYNGIIRTRAGSRSPPPTHPPQHNGSNNNSNNNINSINDNSIRKLSIRSFNHQEKKQQQQQPPETKAERTLRKYYEKKQYTFQNPLHELVSYKIHDVSARIAFEKTKSVTITDLEAVASKRPLMSDNNDAGDILDDSDGPTRQQHGDNSSNDSNSKSRLKKLSPSPQYIELLEMMSQIQSVRQLCWSPIVSREADPFFGWGSEDEEEDEVENNDTIINDNLEKTKDGTTIIPVTMPTKSTKERDQRKKILLKRKRRKIAASMLGLRCNQINPEEYAEKTLLDHAPLLTNVRRRLPMRSDVGFPKATEEEITLKQREIAKEAQLEEVSPRLIVLLSSDDVGSPPVMDVDKSIDKKLRHRLKYSLPGMPFAGKELTILKRMQNRPSITLRDDLGIQLCGNCSEKVRPDPSSMFAPPTDSGMSSSEMWRSRPFSDRPAGMSYAVAIPVDVRFSAGKFEPLVCTLALYCLPKETTAEAKKFRGKISEDHIFPAGDWGNLLEEKAGEILARQFGMSKESAENGIPKRRRTKKALFSFDPTALPKNEHGGLDSLFLVMNVHKVTHRDAGAAYMNHSSAKISSSSTKKTFSGLFFGTSSSSTSSLSSRHNVSVAKSRAKSAFDAFGSQLLTPFCFGILPLLPRDPEIQVNDNEGFMWPNGVSQSMVMFSHPIKPESHDAFLNRISTTAARTNFHSNIVDEVTNSVSNVDSISFDDDSNIIAISSEDSMNSRSVGPKRRRLKFKFRNNKTPKRQLVDMADVLNDDTYLMDGTAIFFTSKIGVDFSQTLLQQPSFLQREDTKDHSLPRLLVDVSGDCAIMLNPEHGTSSRKKRSNLIRLPPSTKSSGYSDSCEIREILYLPFQNEMKYESAPCFSPRTSLNLIYLYPRLIRKVSSEQENERKMCYSVRVQLVQQSLKINEDTGVMSPVYVPSESIYNPTPGGGPLLQSVYTKIPFGATGKHSKADVHKGIFLQDEIKVRLPTILDGSHYLQFTLYSILLKADDKNGGGMIQNHVGDTFVPLSSSSTKESVSGKRVTTVIPNGLHRIEIGSFQVQIISRLVSTIHISDPAVATIVRDFTTLDESIKMNRPEPFGIFDQLSQILSKASEQSVYHNFHTLAFIHLRALVKVGMLELDIRSKKISVSNDILLKMEILRSLFKVIDKAKNRFSHLENDYGIERFIKTFLDTFDEQYFNKNRFMFPTAASSQSTSNISLESDQDFDIMKDIPANRTEDKHVNDVGVGKKQNIANFVDVKTLHERYANNAVPFSRTAYGVSKIDRMKAEAELYEEGQMMTELYDDDETVVTASTWHSHPHLTLSTNSFSTKRPNMTQTAIKAPTRNQASDINHLDTATIMSTSDHLDISTPLERARSMAKRVNLVAQIFTAPCTTPDIEATIKSPVRRKLGRMKKTRAPIKESARGLVQEYQQLHTKKKQDIQTNNIYLSGSDVEDALEKNVTNKQKISPYPNSPMGARLRGNHIQFDELSFSISAKSESIRSNTKDPFVYELIWTAWLHYSRLESKDKIDKTQNHELFMKNINFVLPLCLKSLALRCLMRKKVPEVVPSILLDMNHMMILEPLVETIAKGFVNQVVKCENTVNQAISNALEKSNALIDFFTGLLALIHPSQVSWLIFRYLEALRLCEEGQEVSSETASRALVVIRVNRQLRLRAVEKLSSTPRFVALNFPYKFQSYKWEGSNVPCSWTNQVMDKEQGQNKLSGTPDGLERLPETNWLAELLLNECFAICSQSCETIVNKTISQVKSKTSSKKKSAIRQRITIPKEDMAHYHSIGYHSIFIVYDLVLRLHATDCRYQSEEAKGRIAGIFVSSVIENALQAGQCLSKIDSESKIRSVWLLCVLYVLQEAPETALRQQMYTMCTIKSHMKESRLNRFIRILKLCTTTFQSFTDAKYLSTMAPWLLQESFNTISASSILLIDECYEMLSHNPYEQSKMVEGTLELLLQIISAPLSSVTLLRALGAASQVLDKIGTSLFLTAVEDDLQHWGRMIFSLMNSTSLSVRSMAVDLTVSLFGSLFKEDGNIDEVAQIFLTVLPEVVAREIALYSINGLIINVDSVESSMWPLRRALADVEEANPLDDDRVDAQLSPFLGQFCRACQAIIDGVLIELRLQGNGCEIAGRKTMMLTGKLTHSGGRALPLSWAFDADEESLFEAASFFVPETSPLQRIRWLLTLKRLHEAKGQWVEAGETLILCAKTVAEAIPHVRHVWRPSQFSLWTDISIAPWLGTIGEKSKESKVNEDLMTFAHDFLEPARLRDLINSSSDDDEQLRLSQPNIPSLCKILTIVSKESVEMYDKESGMDPLTFARLEELLKIVMGFVEEHALSTIGGVGRRSVRLYRTQSVEEIAMLRKVSTTINELVTKIAERMLFIAEREGGHKGTPTVFGFDFQNKTSKMELFFVRVQLIGKKCNRFLESTTIPTFLDWNIPHICRVPSESVLTAMNGDRIKNAKKSMKSGPPLLQLIENEICTTFAEPYMSLLRDELPNDSVRFSSELPDEREIEKNEEVLYFIVSPVRGIRSAKDHNYQTKKFHCRTTDEGTEEITLANHFPCALSRQATLITRMRH